MKEEKKYEYRIKTELNWSGDFIYIAQKHKYFLGIGYWESLSRSGIKGVYTEFYYKEFAEDLIEKYKNGEIEERDNVEYY